MAPQDIEIRQKPIQKVLPLQRNITNNPHSSKQQLLHLASLSDEVATWKSQSHWRNQCSLDYHRVRETRIVLKLTKPKKINQQQPKKYANKLTSMRGYKGSAFTHFVSHTTQVQRTGKSQGDAVWEERTDSEQVIQNMDSGNSTNRQPPSFTPRASRLKTNCNPQKNVCDNLNAKRVTNLSTPWWTNLHKGSAASRPSVRRKI